MIQIGGCVGLFCSMYFNMIRIDSSIGMFGYKEITSRVTNMVASEMDIV